MEENLNTESRILQAAEEVFVRDGYDGARMQDIADKAGINKALLHYYFRSKDGLFEKVLLSKYAQFWPKVEHLLTSDLRLIDCFEQIVEIYYDLLEANPMLPFFIITASHRDARFILDIKNELPRLTFRKIQEAIDSGEVRPVNPAQFILSFMGMCVFPYLSRPMWTAILDVNDEAFRGFMRERRAEIKIYVRAMLTP